MKIRGNLNALIGSGLLSHLGLLVFQINQELYGQVLFLELFKLLYLYGAMTNPAGIHGKIGSPRLLVSGL